MRERFSKIWVMAGLLVMGLPPSLALGSNGVDAGNLAARISHERGVDPGTFWRGIWLSLDVYDTGTQ